MMDAKKILVADLDGTLVFRNNGVAYFKADDVRAVKDFRRAGNIVVINSGRSLSWLTPILADELPWDYLIAGSGSCVMNSAGELIYQQLLPLASMDDILKLYPTDVEVTFYSKDWVYALRQKKEHSLPTREITSTDELISENLYGMSLHFNSPKEANEFADWVNKSKPLTVEAFVNTKDVDIVKKGCSKGVAMQWLCQYLKESPKELYAIGDSYNDIAMLKAAAHPFTFNQSDEAMKQYAEKCVDSVAELIDDILSE